MKAKEPHSPPKNQLLDRLILKAKLKNDAALARLLDVDAATICKIRRGGPVGDVTTCRILRAFPSLDIRTLDRLAKPKGE